jgi:hypothetical protein
MVTRTLEASDFLFAPGSTAGGTRFLLQNSSDWYVSILQDVSQRYKDTRGIQYCCAVLELTITIGFPQYQSLLDTRSLMGVRVSCLIGADDSRNLWLYTIFQ